jgi:hypothetical protein
VATNKYFNLIDRTLKSEQDLVDQLIVESIKIYGMDVNYIPRTLVNRDPLFLEDRLSLFKQTFPIEMYFENITGFDGDKNMLSKFGLEIRKNANMLVSFSRFKTVRQTDPSINVRPLEGDLIYIPMTHDLWEIKFVEHEMPFYQLGTFYLWRLSVEKYVYSSERIQTGVPVIDKIGTDLEDLNSVVNNPIAENDPIQETSDVLIDFSETDPFSEGNL